MHLLVRMSATMHTGSTSLQPLMLSMSVPAGLIQLFCMSTCLWTFGRYLERVLLVPVLAVPAVYMVSGIAGGLASANLAVDRVTVTSSAAVCGLIGLLLEHPATLQASYLRPVASYACCLKTVPSLQAFYLWPVAS